jgi:hypothetical protein
MGPFSANELFPLLVTACIEARVVLFPPPSTPNVAMINAGRAGDIIVKRSRKVYLGASDPRGQESIWKNGVGSQI